VWSSLLDTIQNRIRKEPMIYYNKTADLNWPSDISDGEDVILISPGNITAPNVSGANVTFYAGYSFTLDPDPSDNQGSVPLTTVLNITGGSSSGSTSISGNLQASADLAAHADSFTATGTTFSVTGSVVADGSLSITATSGVTAGATTGAGVAISSSSSDSSITVAGVTSTGGDINLSGPAGVTVNGAISSTQFGDLIVTSTGGAINVTGDTTTTANVILVANNDIALQGVNTSSTGYAEVRIFANQGGSTTDPFQIGQSGAANGVAYIYSNADYGRTIYITNGNGDITYSGTNTLQVNASNSYGGTIILNGNTGSSATVTMSGTLDVSGSNGNAGGVINIYAPSVIANGATLTTTQNSSGDAGLVFVTSSITVNGDGLTLNSTGPGGLPDNVTITMVQVGATTVTAPQTLSQPIVFGPFVQSQLPLAITGSGNFTINVTGDQNGIKIFGYPFSLTADTTTITMSGSGNAISMDSWDDLNTTSTVTYGGSIAVHLNNNAAGQTPGTIETSGTTLSTSSLTGNLLFDASAQANGNGGSIMLNFSVGSTNDITIGDGNGQLAFSAAGGTTQGNGGQLSLQVPNTDLTIVPGTPNPINLAVVNGVGGQISITANSLTDNGVGASLIADGNGAGVSGQTSDGGSITLYFNTNLALGPTAGGVTAISASANGLGNGGSITINNSINTITLGGNVLANAATSGTDTVNGGTIDIEQFTTLSLGGNVSANAAGNGAGQTVTLNGNAITVVNTSQVCSSVGAGTGDGGTVSITTNTAPDFSELAIQVDSGESDGDGGAINLTYNDTSTLNLGTLTATAQSENGGTITLTNGNDADLDIVCAGDIDTSAQGDLAGSLSLVPFDTSNDNISLTIGDDGGLATILSATAVSIDIEATPAIALGIAVLTSTGGDITIDAPASGEVVAVTRTRQRLARQLQPRQNQPLQGQITIDDNVQVTPFDGNVTVKVPNLIMDTGSGVVYTGTEDGHTFSFVTPTVFFTDGSYWDGGDPTLTGKMTNINLSPPEGEGLTITLQDGATAGIKNAFGSGLTSTADQPITIQSSGPGEATFQMNNIDFGMGPLGTASIQNGGDITIGSGINFTSNTQINLQTTNGGAINVQGSVTSPTAVELSTSDTGNINLSANVTTTGTTGSEKAGIVAGGNVTQSSGSVTSAAVLLQSNNGSVGTSAQPIQVSSSKLTLNATAANANAFAQQTSTAPVSLGNSPDTGAPTSVSGTLQYSTAGPLTLAGGNAINAGTLNLEGASITVNSSNVTTTSGNLTLHAPVPGPITINEAVTSTSGDVIIQLDPIASNPYPNEASAENTVMTVISNPGTVYWGTSYSGCPGPTNCGIAASSTSVANPAVHNISFDTKGVQNGIVLGALATITAN
jgi:hypothetical protein